MFNLRVAVQRFGREPVVRLLPRPSDPALLATVRLAGPRAAGRGTGRAHRHDLYDAVWRRHSSRRPFSDTAIPADDLAAHVSGDVLAEASALQFAAGLGRGEPTQHRQSVLAGLIGGIERCREVVGVHAKVSPKRDL